MYDFIKANLEVEVFNRVRKLTKEISEYKYYPNTAVIRSETLNYKNLKFELKVETYLELRGSLHKFKNEGLHNYDQFTIKDFEDTIESLYKTFGINARTTRIKNLEFGVNIIMPFNVKTILDSIILYRGKETTGEYFNRNGYLIRVKNKQYEIKIYDKGTQYKTGTNILRYEIKVKTMQYLNSKGVIIEYLSDLLKPEIIEQLGNLLSSSVNSLLIYPIEYDLTNLNQRDTETFLKGRDKTYLTGLGSNNRKKKIKRLRHLFKIVSTPKFTPLTSKLILDQWLKLSNVIDEVKTLPNIIPSNFTQYYTSCNLLNRVQFFNPLRQRYHLFGGVDLGTSIKSLGY